MKYTSERARLFLSFFVCLSRVIFSVSVANSRVISCVLGISVKVLE